MPGAIALAEQVIRAGHPEYFVTANLNYLMLAEEHPRLDEINQRSIAVLADGFPIVQRSRFSVQPLPTRVAGADLIVELSRLAADRGYRIFFLGAAPGVARAAADRLVEKFPALQVAGCLSPPFGTITAADHQALLEEIRQTQPDILLVAFGQPKGECWIFDNLYELGIPLSVQLGASFDFLAGTARRAPVLWQRIGCEWLYRALTNPRRLVPRYVSNALFLARQLLHDITTSVKNWKFSST
ncbi:MAG: WecB/TagA/CpsF family glycosyltransferase [Planctomycetales bacterium]|nr:WecB/TagA/CpsF family glycosyltransferase [Planctomycetales bacterium]